MPPSIHLERCWLMDTFGCFVQYDSMSQQLITTAFTPQSFPNLFTFVPVPEKFPHKAMLRLSNSIPSVLPSVRFLAASKNAIAVQNIDTNRYLCSHLGNRHTSWHAEKINEWEHFFLLTKEMIIGLSLLSDPDLTEITLNNEKKLPNLLFTGAPNHAKIGDRDICIAENLLEIAKLSTCKAHEEIELSFKRLYAEEENLTLKILTKRLIQLTTLH